MNMIEVDPKLFVKCRLCLEETGQYQIVPKAQMQIKYCFDIDVAPFDGLPQLVCKKCESILTQYAGIKQMFQEKQKNLKSKLNANVKIDSIIQQQDTVSSTQADTENNKNKLEIPSSSKINRSNTPVPKRHSSTETLDSNSHRKKRKSTESKSTRRKWQKTYTKHFVCRFCARTFKDKKGINTHISKQCKLFTKYSSINKSYCLVALNKIGAEPNITGSMDKVVCNQNKVVQSRKANYYILYINKSKAKQVSSSESSDEDFFFDNKKRKRRRLISRSSSETVVIDNDAAKSSNDEKIAKASKSDKTKIVSDVEYVNIDDSDSNSTKSVKKEGFDSDTRSEQTSAVNDKMVNNIIAMCYNKFMNRLNAPEGSTAQGHTIKGKEESSLKHKILSIGRKIIYGSGINTTGLLRYMEHKNLEVVWVPTKIGTKVVIKTRTKESGDNDVSNHGWENITSLPNHNQVPHDFALDYERISELEEHLSEHLEKQSRIQETQCSVSKPEKPQNVPQKDLIYLKKLGEHETLNVVEQGVISDAICEKSSPNVEKSEAKIGDNTHLRAALDAEKNWKKLLNANPVANPKQLPKKNSFNEPASIFKVYSDDMKNDSEFIEQSQMNKDNEMLHMPIITSTVSLAQPPPLEKVNIEASNQNTNELTKNSSKPQPSLPKIKVKPVSELMSDKALSQQNNEFVSTSGWTVNQNNQSPNVALQTTDNSMVFIGPFTNVVPMQQDLIYYPQGQGMEAVGFNPPANHSVPDQLTQNREVVKMHTVELPNTTTNVPLRYLQKLLQIHNILLLDSTHVISSNMKCLSKFKVLYEQETTSPIRLCLMLFCENNVFCIKVRDHFLKELDVAKFSANWQWEILQVFRGEEVVSKLLSNATKLGNATLTYTTYFTNLLKSIVYTRKT